jgi:hypothetical protein
LYDDNDILIANDLPDNFKSAEIVQILTSIEGQYDSLFRDDPKVFEYVGFASAAAKKEFMDLLDKAVKLLKEKVGNDYEVYNWYLDEEP